MNIEVGGARVLTTLLVLVWLICGGVAVRFCLGSDPVGLPYPSDQWHGLHLGVAAAAVAVGHGLRGSFIAHRKEHTAPPGAAEFWISVWGFVALFLGWFASLACVIATGGGWTPAGFVHYSGFISAMFWTIVAIVVVGGVPLGIVLFFSWLAEGFRAKS